MLCMRIGLDSVESKMACALKYCYSHGNKSEC